MIADHFKIANWQNVNSCACICLHLCLWSCTEASNSNIIQQPLSGQWFVCCELFVTCVCIDLINHWLSESRRFINEAKVYLVIAILCMEAIAQLDFGLKTSLTLFFWLISNGIWMGTRWKMINLPLVYRDSLAHKCNWWLTNQILSEWQIAHSMWEISFCMSRKSRIHTIKISIYQHISFYKMIYRCYIGCFLCSCLF